MVERRTVSLKSTRCLLRVPSGKKLGDCTGPELIKAGGWIVQVGKIRAWTLFLLEPWTHP
jgi:hypothetical protein